MKLFKLTILALMFSFSGALIAQESTDQEAETEEPEVKVKALAKADAFYDAKGSYNLTRTCNTWTNNALKAAGLKACLWTPFDSGIFWQYRNLQANIE